MYFAMWTKSARGKKVKINYEFKDLVPYAELVDRIDNSRAREILLQAPAPDNRSLMACDTARKIY